MKKLLIVLPVLALLAAGCNSTQQATNPTNTQTQDLEQGKSTVYKDEENGFSFIVPTGFTKDGSNPKFISKRGFIEVDVLQGKVNPKNFETFDREPAKVITVGGKTAYESYLADGGSQNHIVAIDNGTTNIMLRFDSSDGDEEPKIGDDTKTINAVLNSFKFN